jgi:hypothetical protein
MKRESRSSARSRARSACPRRGCVIECEPTTWAGAIGVDAILGWLDAFIQRGKYRPARAIVVGAGVLALCVFS